MLTTCTAASCLFINSHFRKKLRLFNYAKFSTTIPTVIIPCISGAVAHVFVCKIQCFKYENQNSFREKFTISAHSTRCADERNEVLRLSWDESSSITDCIFNCISNGFSSYGRFYCRKINIFLFNQLIKISCPSLHQDIELQLCQTSPSLQDENILCSRWLNLLNQLQANYL